MRNFDEDFKEWLLNSFFSNGEKPTISSKMKAVSFKNNPFSMQWGVYVDFFDEHGVLIGMEPWIYEDEGEQEKEFTASVRTQYDFESDIPHKKREDARKSALEWAIAEYNKLTKD